MVQKFKPQELNVSDQAIAKIKNLLDEETKDNLSLRVFVTGGGCSGFQYGFKLDDERDSEDTTISSCGVSVVIDSLSVIKSNTGRLSCAAEGISARESPR